VVSENHAAPVFRVHLWLSVGTFIVTCLYMVTTSFPFTLILKMELACSFEILVSTYIDTGHNPENHNVTIYIIKEYR